MFVFFPLLTGPRERSELLCWPLYWFPFGLWLARHLGPCRYCVSCPRCEFLSTAQIVNTRIVVCAAADIRWWLWPACSRIGQSFARLKEAGQLYKITWAQWLKFHHKVKLLLERTSFFSCWQMTEIVSCLFYPRLSFGAPVPQVFFLSLPEFKHMMSCIYMRLSDGRVRYNGWTMWHFIMVVGYFTDLLFFFVKSIKSWLGCYSSPKRSRISWLFVCEWDSSHLLPSCRSSWITLSLYCTFSSL